VGGLVLKDTNGQSKAYLVQYAPNIPYALIMLPNRDLIYINPRSGLFGVNAGEVFYTGANCTGTAYTGRSDSAGPHVINRIYVGINDSGTPTRYFHADSYAPGAISYVSYRDYMDVGRFDSCVTSSGTWNGLVQVTEMSTVPDSLAGLAPISFVPQ
jgi:hypothetical protein